MPFDTQTLQAALVGYEQQRGEIAARIAEIKRQLGGRTARGGGNEVPSPMRQRRRMSASARARIAAAQRARWAKYRKQHKA